MVDGLGNNGLMPNLKSFMKHSTERQNILSTNISNANIPKAKSMELVKFSKAITNYPTVKMQVTSPLHLKIKDPTTHFRAIKDKEATNMTPNQNNIDLVQQSSKMEENNANLKLVTELYKKYFKLRKTATGNTQ